MASTPSLPAKLFSTAAGAGVAVTGVLLLKPHIDGAGDETRRKVLSAAAVFWVTLVLRAVAALVWGVGAGVKAADAASGGGAAAGTRAAAARRRPRRAD